MLFMVLVFMIAIGSLVYLSGLQAQASNSAEQAQSLVSQRSDEALAYSSQGSALSATDTGPSGVQVVGMIMKFENGTSYVLGPDSTPPFAAAYLSSSGEVAVQSLVPDALCPPGAATCASKYNSIAGSSVAGRALGLVTSMGNTFWYIPSASAQAGGAGPSYYFVSTPQSTTSASYVGVPGLSFAGSPSTSYVVQVSVVFYQSNPSNPAISFAISVPSGSTFLFCGGLYWSNPSQATLDLPPANLCSTQPNLPLGPTAGSQTSCVQQGASMCEFEGTAYVSFGPAGGQFQFEFKSASTDTATVVANSALAAVQAA